MTLRLPTEADFEALQSRIKGKVVHRMEPVKPVPKPKKRKRVLPDWGKRFQAQCWGANLPVPELEYRFCERRWRFDAAWPALMVALEVEGGIWTQGRHTRGSGFLADLEKYNEAARLGWRLFRFVPAQVAKRTAVEFMKAVLT